MPANAEELAAALNKLIHAYEDQIDDYGNIQKACAEAKKLLPNYNETPIFTEYG
jgi:hypothetical protein